MGWSLQTFYELPLAVRPFTVVCTYFHCSSLLFALIFTVFHYQASVRRQFSPFVNRTGYSLRVQQIEDVMRAASPWLAGVMNDIEFSPWLSAFPDLDERLGNLPSSSAPEWPSFTDWPTPNTHTLPVKFNWTLEKLMFNMLSWTHNSDDGLHGCGQVLRITGSPGRRSAMTMVAQLFQVSFQWKNPDFLLRNSDFPIRNSDFLLKHVDFYNVNSHERQPWLEWTYGCV